MEANLAQRGIHGKRRERRLCIDCKDGMIAWNFGLMAAGTPAPQHHGKAAPQHCSLAPYASNRSSWTWGGGDVGRIGVAVVVTGFIGPVHIEALRRLGVQVVGVLGSSVEVPAE